MVYAKWNWNSFNFFIISRSIIKMLFKAFLALVSAACRCHNISSCSGFIGIKTSSLLVRVPLFFLYFVSSGDWLTNNSSASKSEWYFFYYAFIVIFWLSLKLIPYCWLFIHPKTSQKCMHHWFLFLQIETIEKHRWEESMKNSKMIFKLTMINFTSC
jgi:hypothetical protein